MNAPWFCTSTFLWGFFFIFSFSIVSRGAECPPCGNFNSSGCREWGNGKIKFIWASDPSGSSNISLSAGSCGGGGESGKAYIFTYVDTHNATCNGEPPCDDGYISDSTFAVIRVEGSQEAFQSTLGGLSFEGDKITTSYGGQWHRSAVGVSQTGCDYTLALGGSQSSGIRLIAGVSRCEKKYDGSRFGITVKIYEKQTRPNHSDRYILLANTSGSISVKTNDSRSSKPQNYHPDMLDSSPANNKGTSQVYSSPNGQSQWKISYKSGYEGSCSTEDGWAGPNAYGDDYLIPYQETFYRVKYPGWGDSVNVNHQPDYVTQEGWFYDRPTGDYYYDMGDEGKIYYHCQPGPEGNRLRTIERCAQGISPGSGQTEWTLVYDIQDRLQYIHNGTTGDPNNILNATKHYEYVWSQGDGNDPDVTYYTRSTIGGSWQANRQWQMEFDADGRPTKHRSGCGSGCSAQSGEFEHVEYAFSSGNEGFEDGDKDYVYRQYNAAETLIEENEYEIIEFGEYVSAGWVRIANGSFEAEDVTDCESLTAAPLYWQGTVENAQICDSNEISGNTQYLHLGYNTQTNLYTTLRSSPISDGRYELSMRAREIGAGTHAIIELYAGSEPLLVVSADDVDLTGQWQTFSGIWDCGPEYEDLVNGYIPFQVRLSGSQVEIDDLQLNITKYVANRTKPIVRQKEVYDPQTSQMQLTLEREFDRDNYIITEKQYTKPGTYRLKKSVYEDKSFSTLVSETVYENLNADPSDPQESTYTTTFGGNDPNSLFITYYPSGRKADVKRYDGNGNLVETYVLNLDNDANSFHETYEYAEFSSRPNGIEEIHQWNLIKHTDSRNGVTEYEYLTSYDDPDLYVYSLLKKRIEPDTDSGRKATQYYYNDARQVERELTQDGQGRSVNTWYHYNSKGLLESQEVIGTDLHALTSYKYNDFGQETRTTDPDGVAAGKSYDLGGELVSEFVIADSCDPNDADADLTLISQTQYSYTADGQIERIGRYKSNSPFSYQSDMDTNPGNWVVTKYEYYPDGKKKKTIEDYGTGRANLTTEYQYNLQGELEKITYPTGKWVKTTRDGRGLVIKEQTGCGTDTVVLETTCDYDADGNLIRQDDPDGTSTLYSYDNFGRLEKTWRKDTNGPCTVKVYGNNGEVIREYILDADGSMLRDARMEYDDAGQLFTEQLVKDLNHPSKTDDHFTFYYYDIAGNLEKMIQTGIGNADPNRFTADPNEDVITLYGYDALNRRIRTTDPMGIISSVVYSPGGRGLELYDPNSNDPNVVFLTKNIYDSYGRLEKTANPMGHYTTYIYNSLNQVTQQTVYDCNETPSDPADDFAVRQVRMEYDNLGNLTKQIVMADPSNTGSYQAGTDLITESVYDSSTGLLDKIRRYFGTSATVAETNYDYDNIGRKYRTTDPAGNVEEITYYLLADGNPAQVKKTTKKEVNSEDSQEFYTITAFFEYDGYGRLYQKVLDTNGDGVKGTGDQTTTYTYDGMDRLTDEADQNNTVTHYEYDGFGNVEQKIDDFGTGLTNRTTQFVYSRLNRLYQIEAYDPNDTTEQVSIQITTYDYDQNGNVTKITYPDQKYVEYEYNILNKVEKETRRDGSIIYYWYDTLGNRVAESDDAGGQRGYGSFLAEFWYNGAGNLVYAYKEIDGEEVSQSEFTYNGFGLHTSESAQYDGALSKTTYWTVDGSGNVLTQTHGDTTLTFTPDGLGRIKTIDRGQTRIVNYTYLGTQTDTIGYPEPGVTQEFGYDDLGRILRCRSADVNDISILDFMYHYDVVGNRDSVRYNHLSPQVWENYSYDRLYRLEQADYGAASGLAFNAGKPGDIHLATLARAASIWLNDTMGTNPVSRVKTYSAAETAHIKRRILSILRNVDDPDIAKLVNSIRSVSPVAYNPDAPVLRLVELGDDIPAGYYAETCRNDNNEIIAQIVWDNNDRMVLFAMYPDVGGTVVITMDYDSQNNLTSEVCITYDDGGNATETVDLLAMQETQNLPASSESFATASLDGGDSFLMSTSPEGPQAASESFSYDHLGNRYQYTGKSGYNWIYSHNLVNQYGKRNASVMGISLEESYIHDDNGNLEMDEEGNSYSYDYRNRLVKVEDPGSNTIAEYVYDALGRRIKKTVGSESIYFYYDPAGQVIAEYNDGSLEREFVYGNSYNEVLAMYLPYNEGDPDFLITLGDFCEAWLSEPNDANWDNGFDAVDDDLIDMQDFSYWAAQWDVPTGYETSWYYLKDALGSVRGLVGGRLNREGDREFYNYDVYGKLSVQSSEQSTSGNTYLFAGYRLNSEIEHYHTLNRTYDPITGRWLQYDPLGYIDSLNLYEYAASSPIVYFDPYGNNLYAVDGTWSKKMMDEGITTNVKRFHKYYEGDNGAKVGSGKYYCHGPGGLSGGIQGAGSRGIYKKVKNKICKDWCKNEKMQINLVGWSRGAVIVMEIAEELEDQGCDCSGCTKYPTINWVGLFDAVDMMNYVGGPFLGNFNLFHGVGFAHDITSNVNNAFHIKKTKKPVNIGKPKFPFEGIIQPNKQLIFPTINVEAEDPLSTNLISGSMNWNDGRISDHGDIGTGSDFLETMMRNAESAGLRFNWIKYAVDEVLK